MGLLAELAKKYGTDKYPIYTGFYELLLQDRRRFDIQSVLEIGIGTVEAMKHVENYQPGASLRMWRDYFPSAEIIGIDKEASVMFSEDRIRTKCIDQRKISESIGSLPYFDLIVDDGSHVTEDQAATCIALVPRLHSNGFYIIEDVNEPVELSIALVRHKLFTHYMVQTYVESSNEIGSLALIEAKC